MFVWHYLTIIALGSSKR